jgi:Flp pilus assembly protein CpaB
MVRVGGDAVTSSRSARTPEVGPAPAVRRLRSSRWRDPRLAIGVILVAASVALGARVIAAADDTVPVWSLRNDVPAGSELTSDDVELSHVHFDEAGDTERYFDGAEEIPGGLVVGHDLAAGELLSRSALVQPESEAISEVPLPVADGFYPTDLGVGDRVDVWVAPTDETDRQAMAELVLDDVAVLQTDLAAEGLGSAASTVILVGLDAGASASLDESLAAITTGSVVLVREDG